MLTVDLRVTVILSSVPFLGYLLIDLVNRFKYLIDRAGQVLSYDFTTGFDLRLGGE